MKTGLRNVPCALVNHEISLKVECRTGPVCYEPYQVSASGVPYQYNDIKLVGLPPAIEPIGGDTLRSLLGKCLNIGSKLRAPLDTYECHAMVNTASSSRSTCNTSAAG